MRLPRDGRSVRTRACRRPGRRDDGASRPRATGSRRRTGPAGGPVASGIRTVRSDGLLGVHRQRGLALADGDTAERRRRERASECRGTESCRQLGSRDGRIVSRVWCRRSHADADPPAHHLGKREHAQGRYRRRHPDATPAVQHRDVGACGEIAAGILARGVGAGGDSWRSPRRRALAVDISRS